MRIENIRPVPPTYRWDNRDVSRWVVGWSDRIGILTCRACMLPDGDTSEQCPIYRGSAAHTPEPCDHCGKTLS